MAEAKTIYQTVNRDGEPPLEFTRLPDGRLLFGNYDELPPQEFRSRLQRLKKSYSLVGTKNAGDYLNEVHELGSYRRAIRGGWDSNDLARRSALERDFDRLFTEPRVRVYREAAARYGLDPDWVEAQIRKATAQAKKAFLGD